MLSQPSLLVRILGALVIFLALSAPAAQACQNCEAWGPLAPAVGICRPVSTGVTICTSGCDWVGCWCNESGNYCDEVTVNGSTPGTGTGGSDPCATSSFCPAQCFSCHEGGGIPRV